MNSCKRADAGAQLVVVIVNYETCDLLRRCLSALPAGLPVIVVDNASSDGSAAMVRAEFPQVRLLALETNHGYGAGANRGVAATDAEFVLLLNSDAFVTAGATEKLQQYLASRPRVAIAGPRLLNPDGSLQHSCFPSPGTFSWLIENEPVARVTGLLPTVRRRTLRFSPPSASGPVPWVMGAAMALRRSAFEQVGGFDESYFMYFEEVDLSRRLHAADWEVHFVADASVTHVGGASTSKQREKMMVTHFRSCLHYYRRHYRGAALAFWLASMRAKMGVRIVRDGARLVFARGAARAPLRRAVATWLGALRQSGT